MTTVLAPPAPGVVVAYAEFSSTVAIAGTTEAAATTVVTAQAFTPNGLDSFWIKFFAGGFQTAANVGVSVLLGLFDNGNPIVSGQSILAQLVNVNAASFVMPVTGLRRVTPSAASHTYSIRAWRTGTIGNVYGGGSFQNGSVKIWRDS